MAEKLKNYMEKLDELPPLICKNAEEIREIDEKKMSQEIQQRLEHHVKNLKKLSNEQRAKLYRETQAMYKEIDKLSDRKIKLAQKMYDAVDEHIKEMDQEIAVFHEHQRKKHAEAQAASSEDAQKNLASSAIKPDKRKKQQNSKAKENEGTNGYKPPIVAPVDMPVDPNEPTYCICHQVSFGQMVACDGPRCKNEWFHFQCVGLTSSPVGKWYCDDCKEARKKKNKP
ncbi:Inhibitor of growth protein [Trichostrongylus colubriformis]|uniref:Inhibitor of growth protein n=1 Tax=Trichostrongylus colubriformis TaxID=6319 RepID=A0AAN8FRD0_TRICO